LPLALMLFGFGLNLETSIVALGSTWPVLLVTISATQRIDPRLLEVARLLHLSGAKRLFKIILPAIVGRICVGIRIAAGIAFAVAITVEIALNPFGIGYAMILSSQAYDPALMWAQ